jgi:hypothetical protein
MTKEEPKRTCLGCRESLEKSKLLRFVLAPDGAVVPDLTNKLPGRGAYTCMKASCLRKACDRNQFSRAFKTNVSVSDPDGLQAWVIRSMEDRIASYLALANKAGKVTSGSDLVADTLRKKTPVKKLILFATDISEDIGNKIRGLADLHGHNTSQTFSQELTEMILGEDRYMRHSVQGDGFVDTMSKEIDRYRNFLRGEGCTYE